VNKDNAMGGTMKFVLILVMISLLLMAGCSFSDDEENVETVTDLEIPDGFEFSLENDVRVDITLESNLGEPVPGIVYGLSYVDNNGTYQFVRSNMTNTAGVINSVIDLPSYVRKVFISGFMNSLELDIIDNEVEYSFVPGGREILGDFTVPAPSRNFTFLDGITYNSQGVPNPYDMFPVTAEMLTRVDTSLPEGVSLPNSHPQYLEDGIITNFIISDSSDVWVTFITEGAGYKNSLGFYTYDQEEGAPDNASSLEHILLFPNTSLAGSGGGLASGMQLYIGRFGAGTIMGWFLVQNGWDYGTNVDETALRFYSDKQYNPESEEYNQHQVLLFDAEAELFLLGFDDQVRPGGDNDFNDAVFFVTANPIENIDTSEIPPIDIPVDSDEDGVNDPFDDYPDDPERAFDVYYPSSTQTATLVFEDMWPLYGDYDMNDMVLDYRYVMVTNADDEVKDLNLEFSLRAAGAFFNNGFSVLLPFEYANLSLAQSSDNIFPALVQDENYTILDLFQATSMLTGLPAGTIFNTETDAGYYDPVDFTAKVTLTDPIDIESLDFSFPFNPFITRQGAQNHEIHLMNYAPTDRHDFNLFMTDDDNSNPEMGTYYVSPLNLPWGLNLPESWKYPIERNSINEAYLHFSDWAESGGESFQDWFIYSEDRVDPEKIYQTP